MPVTKLATKPPAVFSAAAGAVLLALVSLGWGEAVQAQVAAGSEWAWVTIEGQEIKVELATTQAKQVRGLGGRTELGPNEGMLFVYAEPGEYAFWMRGMLISIDMVWIHNHRVVHVESRVPPPAPGTPQSDLIIYRSAKPANFVLELAAGRAAELGLVLGSRVGFRFN